MRALVLVLLAAVAVAGCAVKEFDGWRWAFEVSSVWRWVFAGNLVWIGFSFGNKLCAHLAFHLAAVVFYIESMHTAATLHGVMVVLHAVFP